MKFNYLTDDNEKCLAPFFSEAMIAVALYGIFTIAVLSVICWPQKSFFSYIHTGTVIYRIEMGYLSTFSHFPESLFPGYDGVYLKMVISSGQKPR